MNVCGLGFSTMSRSCHLQIVPYFGQSYQILCISLPIPSSADLVESLLAFVCPWFGMLKLKTHTCRAYASLHVEQWCAHSSLSSGSKPTLTECAQVRTRREKPEFPETLKMEEVHQAVQASYN